MALKKQFPLICWDMQHSGPGVRVRLLDLTCDQDSLTLRLCVDPLCRLFPPLGIVPDELSPRQALEELYALKKAAEKE